MELARATGVNEWGTTNHSSDRPIRLASAAGFEHLSDMKKTGRKPAPGELPEDIRRRTERLGIDLGLLEENLRISPLERLCRHDRCVRQILALRNRLETQPPSGAETR